MEDNKNKQNKPKLTERVDELDQRVKELEAKNNIGRSGIKQVSCKLQLSELGK